MDEKQQTVLIVDDSPMNREILSATLRPEYRVFTAADGHEALEIADTISPDLILLDVVLPGMDGYEVCARLKADRYTRNIPVIFLTAQNQEKDEVKGLGLGAIDYIFKPIRPAIVRVRVRNHLELKQYRDFLEGLSATDGLTEIANRRRLDECLDVECRRAIREHTPLSLMMADIDFFKMYNDYYGHLAGDDALRKVARALKSSCQRPADLAARYGGDEFTGILPNTKADGGFNVASNFLAEVRGLCIPHPASPIEEKITISIGVATILPIPGALLSDLVQRADGMLYKAKQEGRNQVRA